MEITEIAKIGGSFALTIVLMVAAVKLWEAYQESVKARIAELYERIESLEAENDKKSEQ